MDDTVYIMPDDIEILTNSDYCTDVAEHFSSVPEVAKPLLRNAKVALSKIEEMLYSAPAFINAVKASESKNLLTKGYDFIPSSEIPRYYMQVRYGSMFSKVKHIRVFSYFADAILFPDGALWRDA